MKLSLAEQATINFYKFDYKGRGYYHFPFCVDIEPPFTHFSHHQHLQTNSQEYDDGRAPSYFKQLTALFTPKVKEEKKEIFSTAVIAFKVNEINFYAVDVTASMNVPRAWGLDFVDSHITKKDHAVILGDFNVPYESDYLKNIKTNFNHAFNQKGNGFRETWFWNIPLLSLDHIWVSKDLEILKTEKIGTFKSDHSMLKTYVKK